MALAARTSRCATTALKTAVSVAPRRLSTTVVVRAAAEGQINPAIKKDVEKVVDTFKAADLPKKAVMCRCWRSEKFPFCDGAHAKHNAATGDNVGPLILDLAKAE